MQHPSIKEDQVKPTYSIIQEELRPVLSNLEKSLTGTLSQQRCNEILSFLQTNGTPVVFLDKESAWASEDVSARLMEIILCLAKFPKNDMKMADILLQGVVEHAEYLYAFNKGDGKARIKTSLGLAFAGAVCHTLALSDMWRMAGFSRFATEYARDPNILGEESVREAFAAIVDLTVENEIPILRPAIAIYRKANGKMLECPHESHFRISDEEYFAQINLDYPGLDDVKEAVVNGDMKTAKRTYVNYLARIRTLPSEYFNPWHYDVVNMQEADEICQNVFFLRAHNARKHDYGEEVDWQAAWTAGYAVADISRLIEKALTDE